MRAASIGKPANVTAASLVNALTSDPQALAQLAQALVSAGLAEAVHTSIDAAVAQHARQESGRLLAGTVSTVTGWLIPATGSTPAKAMVFLGGSAHASACVVATPILPDLTVGAQVWVEPVNGSMADLLIVALRAFTGTPAVTSQASEIATNTSAIAGKVSKSGDTISGGLTVGGVLAVSAPPVLSAGNQETGVAGFSCPGTGGHDVAIVKNFKTVLTNAPSSINTSNLATPTNAVGLNVNLLTRYGFNMFWQASATGDTGWDIQYTTVGNCLLALDAAARMFDHHCDQCGAVHQGVAVTALGISQGATADLTAVSYTCPDCGAMEHFNCALTAADESDSTPQGNGQYATTRGAQAQMIRQLLTLLGLPLA